MLLKDAKVFIIYLFIRITCVSVEVKLFFLPFYTVSFIGNYAINLILRKKRTVLSSMGKIDQKT